MNIFAIGIGGTGAKCVEALVHLHAAGLITDQAGKATRLGTFLVEPDQQSTLLARTEIAVDRYSKLREELGSATEGFAASEIDHYGTWSPLAGSTPGISLDQVFSKPVLRNQASGLAALFDCLYPPEEQKAELDVGFRGRPPIGSAVMSRITLEKAAEAGAWKKLLGDIQTAAGSGDPPIIHLFGSVFGGTGASGVPTLGGMLKTWLQQQSLSRVRVHASLLLPYFDFDGQGDQGTGIHAEARNFQLNTDAALQYLANNGRSCFDQVYLVGSDIKARYDFSIGGRSQDNDAHFIELLAALGVRHGCGSTSANDYAYVLSRGKEDQITWEDIPDNGVVGTALAKAARFAVAWQRNYSLEIDAAQNTSVKIFASGAPWIRRYFSLTEESTSRSDGRPSIRSQEELALKQAIDGYAATLLQWLRQFSGNTGLGFRQELFADEQLANDETYANELHSVVRGSARPTLEERADTVDRIKVQMAEIPESAIKFRGVAGLADSLWKLCIQPKNS
jgi:hypothetical protein